MLRRILCLFGRHKRSRRHVVERDRRYHSVCASCGIEMIQNADRQWLTLAEDAREQEERRASGAGRRHRRRR